MIYQWKQRRFEPVAVLNSRLEPLPNGKVRVWLRYAGVATSEWLSDYPDRIAALNAVLRERAMTPDRPRPVKLPACEPPRKAKLRSTG